MQKRSKLFLAVAFAATAANVHAAEVDPEPLAAKRFAIQAEVTKGGKVVEITNGINDDEIRLKLSVNPI